MSIDLIITIFYLFSGIYALILFAFFTGILLLPRQRDQKQKPISVLIAARNEASHLNSVIEALADQDYPKEMYEVIIIDDRSHDDTIHLLQQKAAKYSWLHYDSIIQENPKMIAKKGALTLAISKAKHEILAFTDADCLPEKKWLAEINALMTDETDFLCGYSPLVGIKGILGLLKSLERSSIFAMIAGSFGIGWSVTSVARNQIYRKSKFQLIDGFAGLGNQRSGDDDLLLQKMAPVLRKHNFIFEPQATVPSIDKENFSDQIHLETRRASKWRLYPLPVKLLTLFFMIYYLILISALILAITGSIPLLTVVVINLIKIASEFLLLALFLHKIKQIRQLLVFPLAELLYIPFYIYFGFRGTFGKYSWKK
jgi:poly-beta-1,6-N-acetyl-D-glucosamine synthase